MFKMGLEEEIKEGEKKVISKPLDHKKINEESIYRPVGLCKKIEEMKILRWLSAHSKIPFYGNFSLHGYYL